MPRPSSKLSKVAQFVSHRIHELRSRRSQLDIAIAAGFQSPNMLSMIKDGKAKLPMERVVPLAKALECESTKLAALALEQYYGGAVLDTILAIPSGRAGNRDLARRAAMLRGAVSVAVRDIQFSQELARSLLSRADRIEERLRSISHELDRIETDAGWPAGLPRL